MGERTTCYNCFKEKGNSDVCPHCGHSERESASKYPLALPPGTILDGRYIVGRVLGQGGFGATYVAQEYSTKKLIAIKEYLPVEMATRTATYDLSVYGGQHEENFQYGKDCFLEEAKTLAKLKGDPNIVEVFSFFEEHNTAYLTMEYVDGKNLQQVVKEHGGRLSVDEANRILIPIMEAVGRVHEKGIIHRDIAPDNIMIDTDGVGKLIDFGAARYNIGEKSCSLDVLLKHGFAPKEQYSKHGHQGAYTDVYAMAATYYYAITGKVPQESIDRIELDQLVRPSALNVDIEQKSEMALLKALAVKAEDRYQSMKDFVAELIPEPVIPPTTTESLLKKAFDSLAEKNFAKAVSLFDIILEDEPENAKAWIGKLLAENKAVYIENLGCSKKLAKSKTFLKALEYASAYDKEQLTKCIPQPKVNPFLKIFLKVKEKLQQDKKKSLIAAAGAAVLLVAVIIGLSLSGKNTKWEYDQATRTLSLYESMDQYVGVSPGNLPWAKYKNEINAVSIGDGIRQISDGIFSGYSSINKVSIRNGVESIGSSAFSNCTNLKTVTIADSVLTIGSNAFSGCGKLSEISMSNSIQSIGSNAFSGCPAEMNFVYGGTDEQWMRVSVAGGNDNLVNAYYTMLANRPELVLVAQKYNLEAVNKEYNYVSTEAQFLTSQVYTLLIDNITVTQGKTNKVTMRLYDFTANRTLFEEHFTIDGNSNGAVCIFNTPAALSKDVKLLLYAGIPGKTNNIGISYEGVRLYKGVYTGSSLTLKSSQVSAEPIQSSGNFTLVGKSQYTYQRVCEKVQPSSIYTVCIDKLTVKEGTPNGVGVRLYDFTNKQDFAVGVLDIKNQKDSYRCVIYTPEKLSDDVEILLYCGMPGNTQGNEISFENVRVYSGVYMD